MGAALVLLLVGFGALAAGVLIGRYYVPDDRQLRRTARHSRAYMRALSHLIARDHETVVTELRHVVEENVEDVEPYFALGAMFRSKGEHERAIRVHQALAIRERDKKKLRQRAMYELGLDFRAAGMPRRATRAMEEVLLEEPSHEGALRALAALYEEQARFNEAAGLWQRLGKRRNEDTSLREHHLLVAAAQAALARDDADSAKQLLKAAQRHHETAHFFAAAAELAAARGNHRGAKERLKQALIADPALVPHLLPGLIAAEQGIASAEAGRTKSSPALALPAQDELADEPDALPAGEAGTAGALAAASGAAASSAGAAGALAAASGAEASGAGVAGTVAPPSAEAPGAGAAGALAAASGAEAPGAGAAGTAGARTLPATTSTELVPATPTALASTVGATLSALEARPRTPVQGVPLVPPGRTPASVTERVLAVLAEVEAQTGPRLELALIRAQLVPPTDDQAQAELASALVTKFPDALAARVATARLALRGDDAAKLRAALEVLVADHGALAWALRGRWQCAHCGHRPGPFSWRCGQCRRWNTLRMETGVEPPPVPPRERRSVPRTPRPDGLLGAAPDDSLPAATLDPGLTEEELARAGTRRSLLGRVGNWISGAWRRGA